MNYYGTPFKVSRGATQGDLLYPTIFKTLVDAVICHWETVVKGEELVPEGIGRAVQRLDVLFYGNGGILASPWSSGLQEALDVLTGLFDWIGLRINVNNMVGIICQSCRTASRHPEVAYT